MARVCSSCDYYDVEGEVLACPDCGKEMRLTFLMPPSQTEAAVAIPASRSEWDKHFTRVSQPTEQSGQAGFAQITAGVSYLFLITWAGSRITGFSHADAIMGADSLAIPLYLAAMLLGVFVLAAVTGGGIAGAWSINWPLQGVAVGAGFFLVVFSRVLLIWFIFPTLGWEFTALAAAIVGIVAFATTLLTTFGAFLGHVLIRPIRTSIEDNGLRA